MDHLMKLASYWSANQNWVVEDDAIDVPIGAAVEFLLDDELRLSKVRITPSGGDGRTEYEVRGDTVKLSENAEKLGFVARNDGAETNLIFNIHLVEEFLRKKRVDFLRQTGPLTYLGGFPSASGEGGGPSGGSENKGTGG